MRKLYYPGKPFPIGATWDGDGVNFAIFSENAERIELCLFQGSADELESDKVELQERTGHIWHIYIPGLF